MRIAFALPATIIITLSQAQDHRTLDSLRTALSHASNDSTRVRILLHMAGEHLANNTDSAFAVLLRARSVAARSPSPSDAGEVQGWLGYLEEQRGHITEAIVHYDSSLVVCERLHDRKGLSAVLNNLAAIYKDQGRIEEALAAHRRSLSIRQELKDSSGIATSLNNIGLIEYDLGRIPDAMARYAEALRIYERIHESDGTATVLHNIAGVYHDQGDLPEALAYFQRALMIDKAIDDLYSEASTEDNIGEILEQQGRYDDAMAHFRTALSLHDSLDDRRGAGYSLRNIARVELMRKDATSALIDATKALAHFETSDDKRGRASALWVMGSAQAELGNAREAERSATEALSLARALGYPQLMRDAAQLLGRLYRAAHRWQEAIAMQDLYSTMRDSVLNQDARRSAIRQQYAYAYEKKEAALKAEQAQRDLRAGLQLQQERNRRNVFVLIGTGVLLLAIGLWTRLRYVRRSRAAIQQEKEESERLLLNILPEEVARELKSKGEAEARQLESVTVLFTDFKGFTAMSEKLSPKDLVKDIHACFSAFDRICGKFGLEKIKTIGDAYMAAGGLPTPNASHAVDAIQAALEMRDLIAEGKALRMDQGLPFFEVRIGIHTGPVVAGIVGVKKFQYDIWGDTVNTASRMESSGEAGMVNISATTYALMKDDPRFRTIPRGHVAAKGKGDLEMWFVERA